MEFISLRSGEAFAPTDCGLCLGNFDGVHKGHRALVDLLFSLTSEKKMKLPLGALLFRTPPACALGLDAPQLTDNAEKMRLLRLAGLQFAVFLDFDAVRALSPADFIHRVLFDACRCRAAVCGFNYTFGKDGAGTPELLAAAFENDPTRALGILPPVTDGKNVISSSAVRRYLEAGHPEDAARMLGRPFSLIGTVQSGKGQGHAMGYPTANISIRNGGVIPAHGVYLCTVDAGRREYYGICNIGTRPTFADGEAINCETFLFDFAGDLYGKKIRVSLLRFLRAEQKFASIDDLRKQISLDIEHARIYI